LNEQYQSQFQNTSSAQRESLNIQKEMFIKELNEMKRDQLGEVAQYADKKDDPFYKVENRGSRMLETPRMYVLQAYVPETDQKSVKVRVQGDRATVAGARSFKEKIDDGEKKLSTNSYQTFQEEFKFEHPVAQNAIWQERDGDFLQIIIPKIGFVNKKV
jgi:HSP20 family molecular chaperone IbpA